MKVKCAPTDTSRTIALDSAPDLLAIYGINMNLLVEPGAFLTAAGNSSRHADFAEMVLTLI